MCLACIQGTYSSGSAVGMCICPLVYTVLVAACCHTHVCWLEGDCAMCSGIGIVQRIKVMLVMKRDDKTMSVG